MVTTGTGWSSTVWDRGWLSDFLDQSLVSVAGVALGRDHLLDAPWQGTRFATLTLHHSVQFFLWPFGEGGEEWGMCASRLAIAAFSYYCRVCVLLLAVYINKPRRSAQQTFSAVVTLSTLQGLSTSRMSKWS